jgi:ribonuclease D
MGLNTRRDRLCVVQLAFNDGAVYLVQIKTGASVEAPNLTKLLGNQKVEKIFHFARFDMASLYHHFKVMPAPVYCTKIASKLARTYTDRHGLKELCRELLGVEISKAEQSSDWGAVTLTEDQKRYAARDVMYLHALKGALNGMLERENRQPLLKGCLDFLATRVQLDLEGWSSNILEYKE